MFECRLIWFEPQMIFTYTSLPRIEKKSKKKNQEKNITQIWRNVKMSRSKQLCCFWVRLLQLMWLPNNKQTCSLYGYLLCKVNYTSVQILHSYGLLIVQNSHLHWQWTFFNCVKRLKITWGSFAWQTDCCRNQQQHLVWNCSHWFVLFESKTKYELYIQMSRETIKRLGKTRRNKYADCLWWNTFPQETWESLYIFSKTLSGNFKWIGILSCFGDFLPHFLLHSE